VVNLAFLIAEANVAIALELLASHLEGPLTIRDAPQSNIALPVLVATRPKLLSYAFQFVHQTMRRLAPPVVLAHTPVAKVLSHELTSFTVFVCDLLINQRIFWTLPLIWQILLARCDPCKLIFLQVADLIVRAHESLDCFNWNISRMLKALELTNRRVATNHRT
jgi:hypothetical protein